MNVLESLLSGQSNFSVSNLSLEACIHLFSKILSTTFQTKKGVPLLVLPNDDKISAVQELLHFFKPKEMQVLTFPNWDCLPYDRVSPSKRIMAERLQTLITLSSQKSSSICVLTTIPALLQNIPLPSVLQNRFLDLKKGKEHPLSTLQEFLISNGYEVSEVVTSPGHYTTRGGIMDIFPPGSSFPLRLDFFGNTLESLKLFDPETQRTVKDSLDSCRLLPVTEVFLTHTTQEFFREHYRKNFGIEATKDPIYEAVSAGRPFPGQEHWLPYFYPKTTTLLTYTGPVTAFIPNESMEVARNFHHQVHDYFEGRKNIQNHGAFGGECYRPLLPNALYTSWDSIETTLREGIIVRYNRLKDPTTINAEYVAPFDCHQFSTPEARAQGLKDHLRKKTCPVVIMVPSAGYFSQVQEYLQHDGGLSSQPIDSIEEIKGQTGIFLTKGAIERGFQTTDIEVLSAEDLLGRSLQHHTKRRKSLKKSAFFDDMTFQVGDLLVHRDYGIARYQGLQNVQTQGVSHDCVLLVYDQGDLLYVPVENVDVLSYYGSDDGAVSLDRLGGGSWELRKAKAQKKIQEIAKRLIELAALRQGLIGDTLLVDSESYRKFCKGFPYLETEDQAQAIREVLQDLGRGKPMDRLLCGDVGFGKTEVALRASFVAAQAGHQVAIVCPTTLLCAQHFQNFSRRFSSFPLRIESLSRLQKHSETKRIQEGLRDGTVSIVIGTHALFSSKITFKNLGLVIIDEEQHFGVKQKEHLKKISEGVHVLSMSATPIPRSLQMAVSGIRDLSIIATPPLDRLSVHTFVMSHDIVTLRESILREFHRGGQIFYVCPRVADLQGIYDQLVKSVPEVKAVIAHGGMNPEALTQTMQDFDNHRFDVLIATNIVESGLDVPNANTLIVHRSDLFGLSQLYQLRGRVGRSKVRGYAYFTYTPGKMLTENALKRLEVLQNLEDLGSGFSLASRDMDIRGVGNLVGEEQSGHVKDVGISLYHHMLEEALLSLKGTVSLTNDAPPPLPLWSPQIYLNLEVLIPESYVADLTVRLSLYRRLSEIETQEGSDDLKAEMVDRFGPLPLEVLNLFLIFHLKNLCKKLHLEKLEAGPKGILVTFFKNECPYLPVLLAFVGESGGTLRLRPDHKMVILKTWKTPRDQLEGLLHLFQSLWKRYKANF